MWLLSLIFCGAIHPFGWIAFRSGALLSRNHPPTLSRWIPEERLPGLNTKNKTRKEVVAHTDVCVVSKVIPLFLFDGFCFFFFSLAAGRDGRRRNSWPSNQPAGEFAHGLFSTDHRMYLCLWKRERKGGQKSFQTGDRCKSHPEESLVLSDASPHADSVVCLLPLHVSHEIPASQSWSSFTDDPGFFRCIFHQVRWGKK